MLYLYKKIIFYLNLNELEKNDILFDVRYIILSYIHSDFKYIKFNNTNYEIYFKNDKVNKNNFLKKYFNKEKLYIKIDKNIDENFLKSYLYSDYYEDMDNYLSYCSEMNYNKFVIFSNMLENIEIELFPEFKEFFNGIMTEFTDNYLIIDLYNVKFRNLMCYYFS
jgi:hypothetical protein